MNERRVLPPGQAAGELPPCLSRLAWSPWARALAMVGVIGGATLWLALPASAWLALAEPVAGVLRSFYGTRGQAERIAAALARLPQLLLGLSGASYACMLAWSRILRRAPANVPETLASVEWRRPDRRDTAVMIILAGLALALRLPGMTQSLYVDELAVLKVFVEPGPLATILPRSSHGSHPLIELLAWCAMALGGTREWVLRVPALLAGILAVPTTYVVALGLSGRKATARVAALLVAVHSYHAYVSFQLKGYTLVALLALVSASLLVRLLQRPSRRTGVALAVVNALLVYTHLFALYFWATEYVAVTCLGLWHARPVERLRIFPRAGWHELWLSLVGSAFGIAVLYLPQVPVLAMNALDPANQFGAVGHFDQVVAGCSVLLSAHESAWFAGLFLIALAMHFAVPGRREALDALVFVLVLFVTLMAVGPSGGGGFFPRYLSPGLLLTAIIVGDVVARLCSVNGRLGRIGGIALLVAVLGCTAVGYTTTYLPIQDYRGAVRFIQGHASAGAVVVGNCFAKDTVQHYDAQIVPLTGPDQLRALLTRSQQVWAITSIGCHTGRFPFERDSESQAIIEQRFTLAAEPPSAFPVRVWRFDANPADPQAGVGRGESGAGRD